MAQAAQKTSAKNSKSNYSRQQPYRILALDGGGIYGLSTAILLKKLADKHKDFLQPDNINMFVGTSAGALNSLFLAKHNNPREFVLSGGLEAFWDDARIFTNDVNPVNNVLSLMGVTAFLGSEDYVSFLQTHFGDMTLADLPQKVVIDVFDWAGLSTQANNRHWRAEVFTNFANDDNRHRKVVDVGYAAGSPPGLRAVRDGYGDGGVFAPNPSLNGLSRAVRYLRDNELAQTDAILDCISLLSVGICVRKPYYWADAFDFSSSLFFDSIPTNPWLQVWYPPSMQAVMQAPSTDVIMQCDQLIGQAFLRLNPGLVGPPESPPALAATAMARFPQYRLPILQYIRNALNAANDHPDFKQALDYLENNWQLKEDP